MTDKNPLIYKRNVWKSIAMITTFRTAIGLIFICILFLLIAGWTAFVEQFILFLIIGLVLFLLLFSWSVNANSFFTQHIEVFYPFLFWKKKINYSEISFAEFKPGAKGGSRVIFYKKVGRKVKIETSNDYVEVFKILNQQGVYLVIPIENILPEVLQEINDAGIVYRSSI